MVLLLAAIGVGVYAYFTTPLPLGLNSVIRTPGGDLNLPPTPLPVPTAVGERTAAGQALVLGALRVTAQSVLTNQDLAANNRGGPPGSFVLVDLVLQNSGTSPVTPKPTDFQLVDGAGRVYAVDVEATRSANVSARRRVIFDASVPPTSTVETVLAFETPPNPTGLVLRVTTGYGDLELDR